MREISIANGKRTNDCFVSLNFYTRILKQGNTYNWRSKHNIKNRNTDNQRSFYQTSNIRLLSQKIKKNCKNLRFERRVNKTINLLILKYHAVQILSDCDILMTFLWSNAWENVLNSSREINIYHRVFRYLTV